RALAIHKYKIDEETLDLWNKYEVANLAEWFTITDSKSIQARIKRAITWYSHAVNADTKEIQFVSMTTAIEGLLLDKGESKDNQLNLGSIKQRLADRVAYLLGKDFDERVNFATKIKALYDIRSGLVHGGESANLNNSLYELEDIVGATIIAFAKHNF